MKLGQSTVLEIFLALAIFAPATSRAQEWNDARSRELATEATTRRALQLADTGLVDYSATAKGFVTFLAQLGEGFKEPPKIIRADELRLEIFWRAPNFSKQRVFARRDTLLMPTDIVYHRDHLGIIQNNFPSIIRLGDGDEVQDVPHPLSTVGLSQYDFAIRDSLQVRLGPRTLNVYEVRVRPRNDKEPRAIGAVFIDRESHDVVRMAFSFTRAALKDKDLDDVSVVLENGLFEGRFWLPRRQEIEIRRSGTWLDFPARGIIRGRWEICCYQVNRGIDQAIFAGPEIVIPQSASRNLSAFTGKILDSLPPDVRAVTDDDVAKVQDEARALVREQALNRTRRAGLAGNSFSDFAQFNRAEGLSLGAGILARVGHGFSIPLKARYGFSDHQLKGSGGIGFERASGASVRVSAFREYRDPSDEIERSRAVNSLAAQEFGSDYTEHYDVRGVSLRASSASIAGLIPGLEISSEQHSRLEVRAHPASGDFEPELHVRDMDEVRSSFTLERPNRVGVLGFEIRGKGSLSYAHWNTAPGSGARGHTVRGTASVFMEHPFDANRLVLHTFVGRVGGDAPVPPQHLFFLGGTVTAPGYEFHSLVGTFAFSQRVEFRVPFPVPSISLGRYGKTPSRSPIAPFINFANVSGPSLVPTRSRTISRSGWSPSAGIGFLPVFEMVRFDIARGLRDGRWSFSFDVSRDLWSIL